MVSDGRNRIMERSGSITGREFFDKLSDHQLLERNLML
jgi:hypothetical protein